MMQLPRALRLVGYALLLLVLCATVRDAPLFDAQMIRWGVAYVAFAIAFLVGARAPEVNRTRRLAALAVLTPAMLAMAAILPCQFGALSLVIVASQAALVLSPRQVAGWIAAQTLLLGWLVSDAFQLEDTIAQMVALLGFQSFAAVAVYLEQERTRIARELHDVLGHDLTALSLQLEVASHLPHAQAASHLDVAREVSGRLLRNVREVVTAMRVTDGAGLRLALGTLIDGIPSLTIHLDIPDELRVDDAARAHCVLRCVQEIITNALRHARAGNLWIAITQEGGVITVDAHDDGCGAETVEAGCGLSGMRDRIEELGGALRVAPAPSFAVRAMLPLEARP